MGTKCRAHPGRFFQPFALFLLLALWPVGSPHAAGEEGKEIPDSLPLLVRGVDETFAPKDLEAGPPMDEEVARLYALQKRLDEDKSLTTRQVEEIKKEIRALLEKEADKTMERPRGERWETGEEPSLRPVQGGHSEQDYYDLFRDFYELDRKRRDESTPDPSAEQWESLGSRCGVYCRVLDPKLLKAVAPYLLRLRLLQGESYLFASIERFRAEQSGKQLEDYYRGIRLLNLLCRVDPEEVGPIPEPADPKNKLYLLNAGVAVYDPGGNKWWKSEQEMTDYLLADFCPWGVPLYFLLEECGLVDHFDWHVLTPYGAPRVPEVGPLTVLPDSAVPVHIRKDAAEIAGGRFHGYVSPPGGGRLEYREIKIDWDGPPKITHSVCYLSRLAYGLKTSDKVELGWKAIVLVSAGPLALAGDFAQGYLVDSLGRLCQGKEDGWGKLYMAVDVANTADNWGFDKSWLLDLKLESHPEKLAKSLLVRVLNMNEGTPMQRLFSGLVPEHDILQRNAGDPRTYDGRAMPHVIIRTDVHGFEKTGADEYPRVWDVVRFYQLSPRVVAGLEGRYDLNRHPVTRLMRREDYLKANEQIQLNTWVPLPFEAGKPFGFRRHLTDFTPPVQVLRINIPGDVLQSWQKGLGNGEELVALLLDAETKKPIEDSIHSLQGDQLSWRIDNVSLRGLGQTLNMETPMDGTPDGESLVYAGAEQVNWNCFADRLKARYLVKIVRCRQDPEDASHYLWQRPEKKLATMEARFFSRTQPPSGRLSQPVGGIHELVQDYEASPSAGALLDLPFTRCEVNIKFQGKMKTVDKDGTEEGGQNLTFRFDGVGRFEGNAFQGSYRDERGGGEEQGEIRTSTVTATVGPRTYEALKTRFPETITHFTVTQKLETRNKVDGAPYIAKTAISVSGGKLTLDPASPLLKTNMPFHRFMQNQRLRRRYGYAFLQYRLVGAKFRDVITPQYEETTQYKGESRSKSLIEIDEGAKGSVVLTFWFY